MMTLLKRLRFPICPHCDESVNVRKHGRARSGLPRYRCLGCDSTFQTKYIYCAYQTDRNERIGQ